MKIEGPAKALAVYIGEDDKWKGQPLYSAIVQTARELGIAGATVTRGVMGFGANSRIHTTTILRLSEDLPMVVQVVDSAERIAPLLDRLHEMITEGLMVTWDVTIERYVASAEPPR